MSGDLYLDNDLRRLTHAALKTTQLTVARFPNIT